MGFLLLVFSSLLSIFVASCYCATTHSPAKSHRGLLCVSHFEKNCLRQMSVLTFLSTWSWHWASLPLPGCLHSPRWWDLPVSENASIKARPKDALNWFVQIGHIRKQNISAEGYFPLGNRVLFTLNSISAILEHRHCFVLLIQTAALGVGAFWGKKFWGMEGSGRK